MHCVTSTYVDTNRIRTPNAQSHYYELMIYAVEPMFHVMAYAYT